MHRIEPGTMREPFWRPTLAGASATFVGIGLARFGYVPLFPLIVAAGWVTPEGAGLLGALNLLGYLLGALSGRRLASRIGTASALDLGMGLAVGSILACGWDGGLAWLSIWRGLAGLAGGVLMSLAGPAVQRTVPSRRVGEASGVVVTGVGGGVVLASILIPIALPFGLPAAWFGLGGTACLAWCLARRHWPTVPSSPSPGGPPVANSPLLIVYGLSGAGMVPHMIYLSDLAVRGRELTSSAGAGLWLLFGCGAVVGTWTGGRSADRWGGRLTIHVWLTLQMIALCLVFLPFRATLPVAAVLGGLSGIGLTAVALVRAREVAGGDASALWARATSVYAVAQALAALGLAWLFPIGGHDAVFGVGLAFSLAALATSAIHRKQAS